MAVQLRGADGTLMISQICMRRATISTAIEAACSASRMNMGTTVHMARVEMA